MAHFKVETGSVHARASSVLANIQTLADRASSAWGRSAVTPWDSEGIAAYRRRVAREHQEYSPAWKGVDLNDLSGQSLRNAVSQIFADSMAASRSSSTSCPEGFLREVVHRDQLTGHIVKEYFGEPRAWLSQFAGGRPRLARFRFKETDR